MTRTLLIRAIQLGRIVEGPVRAGEPLIVFAAIVIVAALFGGFLQ